MPSFTTRKDKRAQIVADLVFQIERINDYDVTLTVLILATSRILAGPSNFLEISRVMKAFIV
jgi:hypothetical protein